MFCTAAPTARVASVAAPSSAPPPGTDAERCHQGAAAGTPPAEVLFHEVILDALEDMEDTPIPTVDIEVRENL